MTSNMMATAKCSVSADEYSTRALAVINMQFLQAQMDGRFPFGASRSLNTTAEYDLKSSVLTKEMKIERQQSYLNSHRTITLVTAEDFILKVEQDKGQSITFQVASTSTADCLDLLEKLEKRVPVEEPPENVIRLGVWKLASNGPEMTTKSIVIPHWTEIEQNYPTKVRRALTEMMKTPRPESAGAGKLILWHGEPGTGKTTALRALGHAWKDWCDIHYISDPERLFGEAGYLLEVASTEGDDEKYRLVVAEDSDQFLRATAKHDAGAALGRLLNFSDGILGQGSNTLFLLTTNEQIGKLHPAVTRPGRCMANIEFAKFTAEESREWLPKAIATPSTEKTLAELLEMRDASTQRIINDKDDRGFGFGQYL